MCPLFRLLRCFRLPLNSASARLRHNGCLARIVSLCLTNYRRSLDYHQHENNGVHEAHWSTCLGKCTQHHLSASMMESSHHVQPITHANHSLVKVEAVTRLASRTCMQACLILAIKYLKLLDYHPCRELGIGLVAYSPLGRGFLTGELKSRADLSPGDWRLTQYPPMSEENFPHNLQLVERVKAVAAKHGCTPA